MSIASASMAAHVIGNHSSTSSLWQVGGPDSNYREPKRACLIIFSDGDVTERHQTIANTLQHRRMRMSQLKGLIIVVDFMDMIVNPNEWGSRIATLLEKTKNFGTIYYEIDGP